MPARSRKAALRARALAARGARTAEERQRAAEALARNVASAPFCRPRRVVGAYVPIGDEPGSLTLLDILRSAGTEVVLPTVLDPADPEHALGWTVYTGPETLAPGPWGLREPVGPRRDLAALATATAVLVPALLVDRSGHRLGRGGGYYDRVLAELPPAVWRIAVVYDDEYLDEPDGVPTEPHDRPVDAVLTPARGLRRLT